MRGHQGHLRRWQGVWTTDPITSQRHFFSPGSASSFQNALHSFIVSSLQISPPRFHMQPHGASRYWAGPTLSRITMADEFTLASDIDDHVQLSRAQEVYFLALFWQGYHCTIPILNEADFREHYEGLWSSGASATSRKASPLVDIVLALCMQYGMTFMPRSTRAQTAANHFDTDDPTVAGRALYHRCQILLASRAETPSMTTAQCQIFSSVYLRNASFVNMSHNALASAIRTAHILGYHQETSNDCSRAQRELHRRLWWVIYTLESIICMDLGRPWLTQMSHVGCALPADDQEIAMLSGPSFVSQTEGFSWLSYHIQHTKLVLAARAVHVAFEEKATQMLRDSGQDTLPGDSKSLEALASYLLSNLACLRAWAEDIPNALRLGRRDGGIPFSTDRSKVHVNTETPEWHQRQQLLLELAYHHVMMGLFRPFITFAQRDTSSTPLSNSNNISCLNHAIAITNVLAQITTSTDILNGWHEAYRCQWSATLTMVGFIFGNPVCPPTPTARRTISTAIEVLESFHQNFAIASSAAIIARDLAAKVDTFLDRLRASSTPTSQRPPWAGNTAIADSTNDLILFHDATSKDQPKNHSDNDIYQLDTDGDLGMNQTLLSAGPGQDFSMDALNGVDWSFTEDHVGNADLWPN